MVKTKRRKGDTEQTIQWSKQKGEKDRQDRQYNGQNKKEKRIKSGR